MVMCRPTSEELVVILIYTFRMAYHFYKQCDKYLCLLLPCVITMAVSATMAESCGRCQFYDRDMDKCTDCYIACNPAKSYCERVCPGKI